MAPFHQLWIYMVGKMHSGKADQWILASGGSECAYLLSAAISWGNKMNFNLCANLSGFCSDSHKLLTGARCVMVSWSISGFLNIIDHERSKHTIHALYLCLMHICRA